MIRAKRLNAMNLKVRDVEESLRWYREHFGFRLRFGPNYATRPPRSALEEAAEKVRKAIVRAG
jgi:catechol 2,3-dioxygenase-like lactoylglutathione lyase family enzyme